MTSASLTRVGVLGRPRGAFVDPTGIVVPDDRGWALAWRIGADDRWRMPERETAVRQTLVSDAPVVRTAMRVPSGDALLTCYGVPNAGGTVVAEITNDSAAPFVAGLVVRGARSVAQDGAAITIDRGPGLVLPRAPSRWSVAVAGTTDVEVCGGAARDGAFPPMRDRAGRIEAAFLLPVPHRVTVRVAIAPASPADLDLGGLPSSDDAARGWKAQLDRGMRVELPDARLTGAVRAALAQVLLVAQSARPGGDAVAALEDWGFDAEAADAWRTLPSRSRRRARARPTRPPTLDELETLAERSATPDGVSVNGGALLLCLRALLAFEGADGSLTLLAELPEGWRGQPLDVRDVPTRHGPMSYAVRWHGARPALLWSAPAGVRVCAPGLDPDWASVDGSGEALLTGSAA